MSMEAPSPAVIWVVHGIAIAGEHIVNEEQTIRGLVSLGVNGLVNLSDGVTEPEVEDWGMLETLDLDPASALEAKLDEFLNFMGDFLPENRIVIIGPLAFAYCVIWFIYCGLSWDEAVALMPLPFGMASEDLSMKGQADTFFSGRDQKSNW